MSEAWELEHDALDGRDIACVVPFPGWEDIPCFGNNSAGIQLPRLLKFSTNFRRLKRAPDYPRTNVGWPIMSARMLELLCSVSDFEHRAVPVALINEKAQRRHERDQRGLRAKDMHEDYFAIQMLDRGVELDWERCVFYDVDGENPNEGILREAVFKQSASDLPALFRVRKMNVNLFISNKAHVALSRARIRGPQYGPLNRLFIPVDIPQGVSKRVHVAGASAPDVKPEVSSGAKPVSRELDRDEQAELMGWADVAAHLDAFYEHDLEVSDEIVTAIDETVTAYRKTKHLALPEFADETDLAMALGAWLGYALKGEGFKLVSIDYNGNDQVAIVPDDGSWALLPLRFMYRMLTESGDTNTTILTYNMCKTGRMEGRPGEYRAIA